MGITTSLQSSEKSYLLPHYSDRGFETYDQLRNAVSHNKTSKPPKISNYIRVETPKIHRIPNNQPPNFQVLNL